MENGRLSMKILGRGRKKRQIDGKEKGKTSDLKITEL
jgi:hypothetical protein